MPARNRVAALVVVLALHLAVAAVNRARMMRTWLDGRDTNGAMAEFLEECARRIPEDATVDIPDGNDLFVTSRLYPRRVVHAPGEPAPGAWVIRFAQPFDRASATVEPPQ